MVHSFVQYYTDPNSGYVFRSKKDVIRYLETGEMSKYAFKPKNMCNNDLKLVNDDIAVSALFLLFVSITDVLCYCNIIVH